MGAGTHLLEGVICGELYSPSLELLLALLSCRVMTLGSDLGLSESRRTLSAIGLAATRSSTMSGRSYASGSSSRRSVPTAPPSMMGGAASTDEASTDAHTDASTESSTDFLMDASTDTGCSSASAPSEVCAGPKSIVGSLPWEWRHVGVRNRETEQG